VQFAPTANIPIAELEEKDWTVMLVMPVEWRHCSLAGIDLYKRFWMIDADSKVALYVNQAYETITGRSCRSLMESPSSYEDVIHPDDRVHVLGKLEEAAQNGQFNERFRIVRPGGEVRWVWARGFPVRDAEGKIRRLVGTVLEITAQRKQKNKSQPILPWRDPHGPKPKRCVKQPLV
jgi:PAS domain S-box-containing protein